MKMNNGIFRYIQSEGKQEGREITLLNQNVFKSTDETNKIETALYFQPDWC